LLNQLKQELFGSLRDKAIVIARASVAAIRKANPKAGSKADAIDSATSLPDGDAAPRTDAIGKFVDDLNSLRKAIISGLKAAWTDDAHPLQGLEDGKITAALDALNDAREKDLSGEPPAKGPGARLDAILKDMPDVALASAPKWTVILEAAPAKVGTPVSVRARIIVSEGSVQPVVALNWFQAGVAIGGSAAGTFERIFTFDQTGPALVSVVAVDASGVSNQAELTVQVYGAHGAVTLIPLQRAQDKILRVQNTVSAVVITVAGFVIFAPSFVGTFAEIFAAFLWGFGTDVGAAKVRELGESLKSLKLPAPKQG
jgi:hypothetical protein